VIQLSPRNTDGRPLKILCLGAHSDDIEIGCGGTILRVRDEYPKCEIWWVVFSGTGQRADEALKGAELFAGSNLVSRPVLKEFRDGYLPFNGAEVKDVFEMLKTHVSPDIVFTHNGKDAHQDHRLLSDLTWNTFRNHLILEYEIPKYDGDLGQPNLFVPLEAETFQQKIHHLMKTFVSQSAKRWFCQEAFSSLMRLRGMECNSESGFAEAFYCRKLVI